MPSFSKSWRTRNERMTMTGLITLATLMFPLPLSLSNIHRSRPIQPTTSVDLNKRKRKKNYHSIIKMPRCWRRNCVGRPSYASSSLPPNDNSQGPLSEVTGKNDVDRNLMPREGYLRSRLKRAAWCWIPTFLYPV